MNTGMRLRNLTARLAAASFVAVALACLRIATRFGPARRHVPDSHLRIHLTGTFLAANWARAHVCPLAAAVPGTRVTVSASAPLGSLPGIDVIPPPTWLRHLAGTVPARLLSFSWSVLRTRPDIIGGFHLLANGIVAIVLARVTGAISVYFCVGGRTEIDGGGAFGENRVFARMGSPSPRIERQLVEIVNGCDLVVTMGEGARRFLRERGVRAPIEVIGGSVACIQGDSDVLSSDVVFVGRLSRVKRVDRLLHAFHHAATEVPGIRLAIVGDGPLRGEMEGLARDLGLASQVHFAGHQENVAAWLKASRVFALTSDSEGLSLALLEALACGVPAVVPDVGDLGDVVRDGVNGFLVRDRAPESYARYFVELLRNPRFRETASQAARASAAPYGLDRVTNKWGAVLAGLASAR